MGAFPLLTSLTLLPPAIPAGVLTLPLLASLALLTSAPAQAQSVSNITETAGSTNPTVQNRLIANAFTTGGTTADRFTLSSVVLFVEGTAGSGSFDVSIHNPGTGSNASNPGTKIGNNLTGTIGSTDGNTTYSAGGGNTITLNGGTTYFVQVTGTASSNRRVRATTSDSETGAGTWSTATIANTGRLSTNSGTSWSNLTGTDADLNPVNVALRFTVNATAVAKTLTATNRTKTGATLTLANHYAGWWYKRTGPTAGTCTSRTSAQTTATLTGLTAGTSYTYKAYSKTGCNAADVIATAMFDTLAPAAATGFTARNNPIMAIEETVRGGRVIRTTKVAGSCHPYHSVENWIARKKAGGDTAAKVIGRDTGTPPGLVELLPGMEHGVRGNAGLCEDRAFWNHNFRQGRSAQEDQLFRSHVGDQLHHRVGRQLLDCGELL